MQYCNCIGLIGIMHLVDLSSYVVAFEATELVAAPPASADHFLAREGMRNRRQLLSRSMVDPLKGTLAAAAFGNRLGKRTVHAHRVEDS